MKHSNSFLLTAALAVALPPVAFAQTSDADEPARPSGGLQEVVVTTQRREESLQRVPVAVTALSMEAIENRQITESRDLQRIVPSLKMNNNVTTPTNLSPALRGSLQQDASLIVAESPFGIYVDDVYIARLNGNNVTLADIERVEVLRGPQGTLYGRNTLAGAIKFISRTPGETRWLDATVGAGNFDQFLGNFSVGGPLGDNWAGSFAAQINNVDGQFYNVAADREWGLQRNWAARGKLRWRGTENFDAVLSVSYSDSENDALPMIPSTTPGVPANRQFTSDDLVPRFGFYTVGTPLGPRTPAPLVGPPFGETQQLITSLNLAWTLGNGAALRSITAYVNTDDYFNTDFSGVGAIMAGNQAEVDQYSQELQLQGVAMDDRLNYIAGVYLFREDGTQDFGWQFITPTSQTQSEAKTDSYSVFGQVEYGFADNWRLTAGGRWTRDEKEFQIRQQILPTALPLPILGPPTDQVSLENSYNEFTPSLGISWQPDSLGAADSFLWYLKGERGFKSGGYSAIAIFNLNDARTPYGPEKNTTIETGIKTDLFGRLVRINAAYFYAMIDDLTLNATAGGGTSFPVQNAGDATIQGLEFEISVAPLDGLLLFLNGAISDAKYDRLNPTASPAQAPVAFGVQPTPPQVPDYAASVGFDYTVPVQVGTFSFGADWFFTDDYVTAATNDFVVKAYDRGNAYLGFGIGEQWDLRLAVKNLGAGNHYTSGSRALGGLIVLPPRSYMLTASYRF